MVDWLTLAFCLQAVINLLSSPCPDSQREAALLLGQFATAEGDYKSKIVQRGAVAPLIEMLAASDPQLREMAAFALGRLAQHSDNQVGG
jgi:HEAT repeat protein